MKKQQTILETEHEKLNRMIEQAIKSGSFKLNHEAILKQSRKVDSIILQIERENSGCFNG